MLELTQGKQIAETFRHLVAEDTNEASLDLSQNGCKLREALSLSLSQG